MKVELEHLVREWYRAQQAIDQLTQEERKDNIKPLERLVDAHNALLEYARKKFDAVN